VSRHTPTRHLNLSGQRKLDRPDGLQTGSPPSPSPQLIRPSVRLLLRSPQGRGPLHALCRLAFDGGSAGAALSSEDRRLEAKGFGAGGDHMGAQSLAQRRALADSLNSGLDVGFARVSGASGAVAGPIPRLAGRQAPRQTVGRSSHLRDLTGELERQPVFQRNLDPTGSLRLLWDTWRRFDPGSSPSASLAEAVCSPGELVGKQAQ
jgi:hypothetical protein